MIQVVALTCQGGALGVLQLNLLQQEQLMLHKCRIHSHVRQFGRFVAPRILHDRDIPVNSLGQDLRVDLPELGNVATGP